LGSEGEWTTFESPLAAARELGLGSGSGGILAAVGGNWEVANGYRKAIGRSRAGWTFEWVKFVEYPGEVWKDVTVEVLDLTRVGSRVCRPKRIIFNFK